MELNDKIKYYRKSRGMTQEELADRLHVSHAAISKWERGFAYPDIKLLPIMARVFHTDLNTLLSFHDVLNEKEIAALVQPLTQIEDVKRAFDYAQDQLFAFPDCERLRLACADALMSKLYDDKRKTVRYAYMEKQILDWYEVVSESKEVAVSDEGKERLIRHYLRKEDFTRARELLTQISTNKVQNSDQGKLQLFLSQGEYKKAEVLCEELLFELVNQVILKIQQLMELRRRQNCLETADGLSEVIRQLCVMTGVWSYPHLLVSFETAIARQDRSVALDLLEQMLNCFDVPVQEDRILFLHLKKMPFSDEFNRQCKSVLVRSIQSDELAFLKEDPRYPALLQQMQTHC